MNYVNGNLLDATEEVLIHGCNAQGLMNSGVAKAIRNKWHFVYDDYREEYEKNNFLSLGSIIPVRIELDQWLINAITQEFCGSDGKLYLSYSALEQSLVNTARFMKIKGLTSIAMPKIGAGLAGGDWNKIEEIVSNTLIGVTVTVYYI